MKEYIDENQIPYVHVSSLTLKLKPMTQSEEFKAYLMRLINSIVKKKKKNPDVL